MLQNAVSAVPALAGVKITADQLVQAGQPPQTFETYLRLLESAAQSYDKSNCTDVSVAVHCHQVLSHTVDGEGEFYDTYNIDTDISLLAGGDTGQS